MSNTSILEKHFSDELFLITERKYNGYTTIDIIDRETNTICLELVIFPPHMNIELLNKCRNGLSGKKLLNIVRTYAELRNDIIYIELEDASLITNVCVNTYHFSLAYLYILSTGKSWYNSFGYKSANHQNEINHNSKLLEMNIIYFIFLCNSKKSVMESNEVMENSISKFYLFFNIFYKKSESPLRLQPTMTVKETFTRIKKYYIKQLTGDTSQTNTISCEYLSWLFRLITESHIILYDSSKLILDLSKRNTLRNSSYHLKPFNPNNIRRHSTNKNNYSKQTRSKYTFNDKKSITRRRSY